MDYKIYWVGERPGSSLVVTVLDEETGLPANLAIYSGARMVMLDSNNRAVNLEGTETAIADGASGRVLFGWPEDRSLFTKPGEYVFQLEFYSGTEVVLKTTAQTFLVKKLGGTK